MAFHYNPKIVTDQLSLCLDAGNPKSYPNSSSNDWFDLSSNGLTFSSYGTKTPLEVKGGALSFDLNGSGYWQSDSGHENVDMGGDCTLLMWIYCEDLTERDTIFEKVGNSYASYEQEIAVTWETNETFTYYSRKTPNYDYGYTNAMTANAWNFMGIKMSTGRTATARTGFYSKNGAAWVSNYNSRSDTALVSSGAVRVGTGYAGAVEQNAGNIAMVLCYNKMLSDVEVKQNFNATRKRFGL